MSNIFSLPLIDRRPPALDRLLQRLPAKGPEHHWEGSLQGASGSASGCEIPVRATLSFQGAIVEGAGRLAVAADKLDGLDDHFDVSGDVAGAAVVLQLWLAAKEAGRVPFVCTGTLAADGCEMSGDWAVACFDHDTCGCNGGGGTFRLTRIG